ncbi:MAG: hypothetical protein KKC99_08210, partial [Proteobacteria bacterium]|nr:hypothetical protein [Pseudomonadota bacterium]
MNSLQVSWSETKPWDLSVLDALGGPPHLVLAFWSAPDEMVQYPLKTLTEAYPHALILGCSTAGEIVGTQVLDGQLTATAIRFAHSKVQGRAVRTADFPGSLEAGKALAEMLPHENLVHVLVLSDGLKVNGSELVRGMTAGLPPTVTITGGLAADGDRFQQTSVFWEGRAESGTIVAVGLYGDKLKIGYGSMGGWDTFGPERMITSSQGNVLF